MALDRKEQELDQAQIKQVSLLENISGLTKQQAKKELMASLKGEAEMASMSYVQKSIEEAKLTADEEARKIIIQSIQRVASEESIDNTVSMFNIESDDMKGRIIGREGRNIRSLEAATGVEIIVDDTPEAIILSCFDPVRREVARLALQKLVSDGRIHPARVEQVVEKTKKIIVKILHLFHHSRRHDFESVQHPCCNPRYLASQGDRMPLQIFAISVHQLQQYSCNHCWSQKHQLELTLDDYCLPV